MGRSVADARSSIRISVGPANTGDEIEEAAEIITCVWRRVVALERVGAEAAE